MYDQNYLIGLVTPIHWNGANQVKQYSVYTEDGEDVVLVGPAKLNERLTKYKNRPVRLIGTFKSRNRDFRTFNVRRIIPLKMAG